MDRLGHPTSAVAMSLLSVADSPSTPAPLASGLRAAIAFFTGSGGGGPQLPDNPPHFNQFLWPTVAQQCIDGTHQAIATAIAVPGPADLPLPGVPDGHTSFIFTALGTGTVAAHQQQALTVYWANLATGATGQQALTFTGINPTGPATVTATAPTGAGPVVAAIAGGLTTTENGHDSTCYFAPTVGWADPGH